MLAAIFSALLYRHELAFAWSCEKVWRWPLAAVLGVMPLLALFVLLIAAALAYVGVLLIGMELWDGLSNAEPVRWRHY